jgi:hypothetical protein
LVSTESGKLEQKYEAADYRVRIFLSVDLSGSTAFKNSKSGENRDTKAAPKWLAVFQHFYTDFPARFQTNYQSALSGQVGGNPCPSMWKAVGDELVFCGRVSNKKAVATALTAFIKTLCDYRVYLAGEKIEINLKGAGWLAAFPEPNRAIQIRNKDADSEYLSASEALENAADNDPFSFDFLGKAIDTGFRIASLATPERFTLSVQLARLLLNDGTQLGFAHEIRLDEPLQIKGVNGGVPYPVLYLDTLSHLKNEYLRKKERTILKNAYTPPRDQLAEYLNEYCNVVGTEEIMLSIDSESETPDAPTSYKEHRPLITEHLQLERGREFTDASLASDENNGGAETAIAGEDLQPLR